MRTAVGKGLAATVAIGLIAAGCAGQADSGTAAGTRAHQHAAERATQRQHTAENATRPHAAANATHRHAAEGTTAHSQAAAGNGVKALEAETAEPVEAYGPWGVKGMEATRKRYPNANIRDYRHIGRQAAETFRYELEENGKAWTVHAIVVFDPQTNELISVELKEEK